MESLLKRIADSNAELIILRGDEMREFMSLAGMKMPEGSPCEAVYGMSDGSGGRDWYSFPSE